MNTVIFPMVSNYNSVHLVEISLPKGFLHGAKFKNHLSEWACKNYPIPKGQKENSLIITTVSMATIANTSI